MEIIEIVKRHEDGNITAFFWNFGKDISGRKCLVQIGVAVNCRPELAGFVDNGKDWQSEDYELSSKAEQADLAKYDWQ